MKLVITDWDICIYARVEVTSTYHNLGHHWHNSMYHQTEIQGLLA